MDCLPLRGGSGLKLLGAGEVYMYELSPSARREWIEIAWSRRSIHVRIVSLCEEGVD